MSYDDPFVLETISKFDANAIIQNYVPDMQYLIERETERLKRANTILCIRALRPLDENGDPVYLYKDNLALDIFKIIFDLVESRFVDHLPRKYRRPE